MPETARPISTFRIGARTVGPGHPVYFIAEAGSNHDRDLGQAKRLIDVAREAGADAVKFQTFRAAALYPKSAGMTDYLQVPRSIYDIIRDLEMPLAWIPELADHCRRAGIDFLSTPFDELSADALEPYVAAYKIASYEMTHHPLVEHCARKGKPLIVSTGTADLAEVRELVAAVHNVAGDGAALALLQCTAKYPAPLHALNVRVIETLMREFGIPAGLSDHSREVLPGPLAAVALGASIIEKHFTLSNALPGPDHAYALEPEELRALIGQVRAVEKSLGDGEKHHHPEEEELRRFARRSLFTTRAVAAGERLTRESAAVLRCGKLPAGLHPREWLRLLGRPARRDLAAEATLAADDLDELRLGDAALHLRPLAASDTERVVAWRNRPEIHAELFAATPPTRAGHEAFLRSLETRSDRVELVIVAGDRPVGTLGLSGLDFGAPATAEYGILLGEPSARGQGIAQRASTLLLDYAFDLLLLDEVRLSLFADNQSARRLYDRLGFVEITPAPAPRDKDGRRRAVTAMRLTRDAWRARATSPEAGARA